MPDSQAMLANGCTLLRATVTVAEESGPVTYEEIAEVASANPGAPSAPTVDVSHLKSAAREKRTGLPDTGQMTVTMNLVKGDETQEDMEENEAGANEPRRYRLMFKGYVSPTAHTGGREYVLVLGSFGMTGIEVDGKIQAVATFEISNKPSIIDPVGDLTFEANAVADGGNAGNGTMGAITVDEEVAQLGDYTLLIIGEDADAGVFIVKDPDNNIIGAGTVGVAFDEGGLAFTLADGSNDFEVGDKFTITVSVAA
jgi:hypothetical protein